ncbi:MAG: hypothetical protein O4803_15155 [Trichodesmium sp. St15_bin1_1]|nr:hypothetical protein [Trichodesmium sp. St15_bin1_1]
MFYSTNAQEISDRLNFKRYQMGSIEHKKISGMSLFGKPGISIGSRK